jgi:hypothetical protein
MSVRGKVEEDEQRDNRLKRADYRKLRGDLTQRALRKSAEFAEKKREESLCVWIVRAHPLLETAKGGAPSSLGVAWCNRTSKCTARNGCATRMEWRSGTF